MRDEYDFSKARKNPYSTQLKKSITIRLDEESVDYFKAISEEIGIPYQTLINLYLRDCATSHRKLNLNWNWSSNFELSDSASVFDGGGIGGIVCRAGKASASAVVLIPWCFWLFVATLASGWILSNPNIVAFPAASCDVTRTSDDILFGELDHKRFTLLIEITVVPYIATLSS